MLDVKLLPQPSVQRRQRHHHPGVLRPVRVRVPVDPVPAVRPRLHPVRRRPADPAVRRGDDRRSRRSRRRLVERLGTKRVVVAGMVVFAAGLVLASTITTATGYPRLGVAMLLLGAGLGLSSAPATESIMGSLPRHRAGVGSAVNDTAREVGGALGVAIVGSITSSIYRSHLAGELPTGLPGPAAAAAHDSLGAALQVSGRLGPARSTRRRRRPRGLRRRHVASLDRHRRRRRTRRPRRLALPPCPWHRRSRRPRRVSAEPIPSAPWYVVACTCTYGYGRICACTMTARHEPASCPCATAPETATDDERIVTHGDVRLSKSGGYRCQDAAEACEAVTTTPASSRTPPPTIIAPGPTARPSPADEPWNGDGGACAATIAAMTPPLDGRRRRVTPSAEAPHPPPHGCPS